MNVFVLLLGFFCGPDCVSPGVFSFPSGFFCAPGCAFPSVFYSFPAFFVLLIVFLLFFFCDLPVLSFPRDCCVKILQHFQ